MACRSTQCWLIGRPWFLFRLLMQPVLPTAFITQMQTQLGKEAATSFLEALTTPPPVSIRFNSAKLSAWPDQTLDSIPWCTTGVYLPARPSFTLDPRFHGGAYYVQEASSMLVETAVRQTTDLSQPLAVLDLAAAPGGKSTLLAGLLTKNSLLLANEVIKTRYQVLYQNLVKWGKPNVIATHLDARDYAKLGGLFDVVLLDAPCSGEGLFRKDARASKEWSPEHVGHCAARQKRIIADVAPLLKPGGVFIYCTCTYNTQENEENVQWMEDQLDFELRPLNIPPDWGVVSGAKGYRCYPHLVQGEGFFISVLQKPAGKVNKVKPSTSVYWKPAGKKSISAAKDWLESPEEYLYFENPNGVLTALPLAAEEWVLPIAGALRHWDPILNLGELKNQDFIPAPNLALSTEVSVSIPSIAVDEKTALQFLKKEPLSSADFAMGWNLIQYEDINLGWVKALKGRVNNYFPKEWRIMMDIPEY